MTVQLDCGVPYSRLIQKPGEIKDREASERYIASFVADENMMV